MDFIAELIWQVFWFFYKSPKERTAEEKALGNHSASLNSSV